MSQAQYTTEHVAVPPRGWRVRTIAQRSGAQVRVAFPPGPRKRGSGKLVSILHPNRTDYNPEGLHLSLCTDPEFVSHINPESINYLIFGQEKNPAALALPALLDTLASGAAFGAGSMIVDDIARKKNGHRNPGTVEQAIELRQEFSGLPPGKIWEQQESHMREGAYTVLGVLLELWLNPVAGDIASWQPSDIIFDDDEVLLVSEPLRRESRNFEGKVLNRSQFYFVGGDQTLPDDYLEDLGIVLDTEVVCVGVVYGINYLDAKSFEGGEESEFLHRFGEETGEVPVLYYHRRKKKQFLVGGAYGIAPVRGDINASPGIVN